MEIIRTVIVNTTNSSISGHVLVKKNSKPPTLTFISDNKVVGHCLADKERVNTENSDTILGFNFNCANLENIVSVTIKCGDIYLATALTGDTSKCVIYTNSAAYGLVNLDEKSFINVKTILKTNKIISESEFLFIVTVLHGINPEYLLYCLLAIRSEKYYGRPEVLELEIKKVTAELKLPSFQHMRETIPIFFENHAISKSTNTWLDSHDLKMDKDVIEYQGINNNIVNIFNDVIQYKGLNTLSPITGRDNFTDKVKGLNLFYFPDDDFYIYLNFGPMMQHSIGFLSLFSHADRFMIFIDRRKDKLGMPINNNQVRIKLEHSYKTSVINSNQDCELSNPSKIMLSNRGVGHFGHAIWNDFSIFKDLINDSGYTRKDILISCCKSFYIKNDDFLKKGFSYKTSQFYLTPNEMIRDCLKKNIIPLFLSNDYISEKTAAFTKGLLLDKQTELSKSYIEKYSSIIDSKKLILLSIRAGSRSCKNEIHIYTSLINSIKNENKDFVFAIDGINSSDDDMSSNFQDIKKLSGLNQEEIEVVNQIEKNTGVELIKCIDLPLSVSIFLTTKAFKIICPWGAGLVKYKWIENKPCFIYGSAEALSTRHPHKDLYDLSKYRENAQESVYYSGKVIDFENDRDTSYEINVEDFVAQARFFILDKQGF